MVTQYFQGLKDAPQFYSYKKTEKIFALEGIELRSSGFEMYLSNALTTEPQRLDEEELKKYLFKLDQCGSKCL